MILGSFSSRPFPPPPDLLKTLSSTVIAFLERFLVSHFSLGTVCSPPATKLPFGAAARGLPRACAAAASTSLRGYQRYFAGGYPPPPTSPPCYPTTTVSADVVPLL
ncbi:hypothetical protein NL676_026200 [Syzygium grande]|nr:hypothetical protein NL676_026200 [Syzygium grande]